MKNRVLFGFGPKKRTLSDERTAGSFRVGVPLRKGVVPGGLPGHAFWSPKPRFEGPDRRFWGPDLDSGVQDVILGSRTRFRGPDEQKHAISQKRP